MKVRKFNTINISKRNPLNAIYRLWLSLGGEPKTPEDLCHFMRVCMFWAGLRWLFSSDRYNPDHPRDRYSSNIGERLPRVAIFLCAFTLMAFVTHIINEGIVLSTMLIVLVCILGGTAFAVFVTGAVNVGKRVNNNEAFETFKDYLSARKQRICPFIEVEK